MKKYKTIVYVDGFNLYYGVLKNTPYKWLNIDLMVKNLLTQNEIIGIKYFTAPVTGKNRLKNQKNYIETLKTTIPYFECIQGHFKVKQVEMRNLNPPPENVRGTVSEEKGTDVNIAVEIVKDSCLRDFDCVVLVSNDSDLERALIIAKENGKKIVLITPLFKNSKSKAARLLVVNADHHYPRIHPHTLKDSLLPKSVGKYNCPVHWNN